MSKIEFKGDDVAPLTTWLKRFSIIEAGVLLEIDTETSQFIAKSYSEDRSIVKMSNISFADLNLTTSNRPIDKRIMVGIFDITKIQKTLAQFTKNFTLTINHQKSVDDSGNENNAGLSIIIKDDILKAGWTCTSLSIFSYISDEKFKNVISNLDQEDVITFDLKKEYRERILTLCDLDKEYGKMSFKVAGKKIYVRSSTFELSLGIISHENFIFPLAKKHFAQTDAENYQIELGASRMILSSSDSNTVTVIGKLDENEYDDNKELDLE